MTGVVIAHVIMVVPYGVVTMLVALSQIDRRIELASRNLGASLMQTTFMVILPNLTFFAQRLARVAGKSIGVKT